MENTYFTASHNASDETKADPQSSASGRDRAGLIQEIIDLIVSAVHLQHVDRSTILESTPLTKGGLGLDSIDILEIVVAVEHKFGVKVSNPEVGQKYFLNIGTIANFVMEKGPA